MDARRILLLVMALVGVLVIYYLVSQVLGSQEADDEDKPKTVQVMVASRNLPIGTILKQGDLVWREWPADAIAPNYITPTQRGTAQGKRATQSKVRVRIANYINPQHVVRSPITRSAPVMAENLVRVGSKGFVAAALKPGMRAVTVRLNTTSGVAGLVYPGDRVDLLLSHRVRIPNRGSFAVTETIIQNLRVLAMGRRLSGQGGAGGGGRRGPSTATFEVPPAMAEKIVLASRRGALSLSLRSLATDDPEAPGDMPFDGIVTRTWDEELSPTFQSKVDFEPPAEDSYVVVHRGERTRIEGVGRALGGSSTGDVPRVRDEILEGRVLIEDEPEEDGEGN